MEWEGVFCLGMIACIFAGMVANRPPDMLLIGALVLVTLLGIISPSEAFAGFSNHGMLTVAALYVVAAALRETGALDMVGEKVLGRRGTERGAFTRLAGSVTVLSAFLNNTPIVAMFIPILTKWCTKNKISPSRLLLPLSYLCILGGTCTLIGTSTNLVVNGLMAEEVAQRPDAAASLHPIGMFELSRVGLPYAIIGITYLFFVGRHLLPQSKDFIERMTDSSREYLVNMRVEPACSLAGKTVEEAELRHLPGLFLIEITRGEQLLSPVGPEQALAAGDILTFTGVVDTIIDLENIAGLVPVADEGYEHVAAVRRARILCEAVLSGAAPCIGKTIRDAEFRAAYGAAVVAVHRGGGRVSGKIGDITLQAGDALLLQASPHFIRANRNNPDFLLVAGVENSRPVRHERVALSLFFLAVLVTFMATGTVKIIVAAFLVAGLMIITRCISASDARRSIDWQTLLTIAAAFGIGRALVNSGCVAFIAEQVVAATGQWGPHAVLAGVYLMTSLFTEAVTNNAAAALVFPFAIAIADQLGVSPRPFAMAVVYAASASFITPLGYQTNLMVFGPGGYRLQDFARIGLPLNILLLIIATVLIPIAWPFLP